MFKFKKEHRELTSKIDKRYLTDPCWIKLGVTEDIISKLYPGDILQIKDSEDIYVIDHISNKVWIRPLRNDVSLKDYEMSYLPTNKYFKKIEWVT